MGRPKGSKTKAKAAKAAPTPAAAVTEPLSADDPARFFEERYPREHHEENPGQVRDTDSKPKTPSESDAFRRCLEMMDVASGEQLDTIVEYCSQRDLRNLVSLDQDLWDMGVSAVNKRRRVINYWARSMGLTVDPHLQQQYRVMEGPGSPELPEDRRAGPRRFFVDEDSTGTPKIRMAKQGEAALTMKEANEFVRQLRDQAGKGNEPVIIFNEALGRHMPNSGSQWVQQNMSAAWATAKEYDRLMASNSEPPDPIDLMVEQMTKVEALKGVMHPGAPSNGDGQGGVLQMVEAMARLEELMKARTAGSNDPLVMMQLLKSLMPEQRPDPMVDILREQNAAFREQNNSLMGQLAELRNMFVNQQFETLKSQNQQLVTQMTELRNRPPGEPTPMTIMKEGINVLSTEAKGLRSDLKDLGRDLIMSEAGNVGNTVKAAVGRTDKLEALTDQLLDLTN